MGQFPAVSGYSYGCGYQSSIDITLLDKFLIVFTKRRTLEKGYALSHSTPTK